MRATKHQTLEYHGPIKANLEEAMRAIDGPLPDTIAARGDVNRNVLAATNPHQSGAQVAAHALAEAISDGDLPKINAWRDIRLDGERVVGGEDAADDPIIIRMTGCPNGCTRPFIAEVGLVGKGPERYNLYLGAAHDGSRLGKLYADDLPAKDIAPTLDPLFAAYAAEREAGEHFGDYLVRAGRVARAANGPDFHMNVAAA